MDEYLSVAEAAAALGMTEQAVRKRIAAGWLRASRIGNRVLAIPRDEVERARRAGRMRPGPKSKEQPSGIDRTMGPRLSTSGGA